jgi:type II secretion system protein J
MIYSNKIKEGFLNNSGFSLIEIIVATAVSSVILLMIYSAHRSIMSAIHDLTGVADFYENINLAIYRMDRDLSCAYFNKSNKNLSFIGENDRGSVSSGKLNFVTIDHEDLLLTIDPKKETHRSDVREVGYFLREDKDVQNLYHLVRREENHYDNMPEEGGRESILLENVVDIKFEFSLRNDWTDKWDSRKYNRFPRAVRVTLKAKNYRGTDEEFTFITYLNLLE